ncbi:MBL fold metallo-hydrolase [Desulfovibrio sp. JC022]|uniref:MBL fold metallo-hydrolase n=1 Tax=Desulfovibrio sp. JC022 TaxID=2593642 RepID=UPI0013D6F2A3|nr:ribonuclease Z [Desulfovibrio sp. JC022]NDV22434.1 ribonuclease Z [Desulfovibrio sp. JC022]
MKCTFIGVGSAFDAAQTNVSMLVEANDHRILLDCGFNAAHGCMRLIPDPSLIDAVWISHFHGDHFFGLPFLLGSFFTAGRAKVFHVCGPRGVEDKVIQAVDLAYPSLRAKLDFDIVFHEFGSDDVRTVAGFCLHVCTIEHSGSALALRLESAGKSVFYSGDGQLTEGCRNIAKKADLGILESYGLDDTVKRHSSVAKCIDFAVSTGMVKVALVHLEPFVRTCRINQVVELLAQADGCEVFLPHEGQLVEL